MTIKKTMTIKEIVSAANSAVVTGGDHWPSAEDACIAVYALDSLARSLQQQIGDIYAGKTPVTPVFMESLFIYKDVMNMTTDQFRRSENPLAQSAQGDGDAQ